MTPASTKENLKREMGVRSLALAIVNITAGSGIFVIPAIIAEGLGATAILAYFVCGALIFLIGLCFAELGSKTTISGGAYTYIENAFGPFAGFIANNIFWLASAVVSDAAIANALADTLKYFIPGLSIGIYRILFLFLVFGALTILNIRSVKNGIRLVEIATLGKLIPMIFVVIVAVPYVIPGNLTWEIAPTISNIGSASLLLFFAFLGLEAPLSNGGEIKNPKRTVPMGIFFGIFIVLVLYISIQLVTQGLFGSSIGLHKDAPLAAVANVALGKSGAILIIAATALAMIGALSGEILSMPRILFAGARDGVMPKPLAKVHPLFKTPYIAIAVYASFGFILAISGGFKQLATIASAATLLIYLGVVLASIKLRKKETASSEKTFRIPGGIVLPLLAAAGILWLLSNLTQAELIGIAIFIVAFSLLYLIAERIKKKKIALPIIAILFSTALHAQEPVNKSHEEVQQTVIKMFDALSNRDTVNLKTYCTADVNFIEYGAVWNMDTLIRKAFTPNPPADYKRSNKLDFFSTNIQDKTAWVSYNLHSDITRNGTQSSVHWVETVILVKEKKKWKVKVLHSTLISRK